MNCPTRRVLRILVVDDVPSVLRACCLLLRSLGHVAVPAANADEAGDLAAADPAIDLVMTDMSMPGTGGLALADHLAVVAPALKVIFVTGSPAQPDELAGRPILLKPFTLNALRAVLDSVS